MPLSLNTVEEAMWYLGIDGGQSSTTAVIGNEEGIILGRGMGGPSNHVYEPGGD